MGPLKGFKIIEIAGIGPGQFAGMLMADMGASLVRIARPADSGADLGIPPEFNLMNRSRPMIEVDLKIFSSGTPSPALQPIFENPVHDCRGRQNRTRREWNYIHAREF